MSHGEQFTNVHSPSALWVQSVTASGFEVCVRQSGTPSNDSGIINWLAFKDRPDITHGSVNFNGYWTTETRCEKISFSQVRSYMQSLSSWGETGGWEEYGKRERKGREAGVLRGREAEEKCETLIFLI